MITGCSSSGESANENRSAKASSSSSIPDYPIWFLHPGMFQTNVITGFAMSSFYEDKAIERAASDAVKTKQAYDGLGIRYTTFWEQLPDDSFRLTGEEFHTDTLATEIHEFRIQDYATIGRMTIAAVSATGSITLPQQRIPPGPRPEWVQNPPKPNTYIFAVGYSPVYYYEHESWKRAELQALKRLAEDQSMKHQRVERSLNGAREAITLQTSTVITGPIWVIDRWRDQNNSYVLIKSFLKEHAD